MTTSDNSERAPCAVCASDFDLADLVSVGGYPLCQPCLVRASNDVGTDKRRFHKIDEGKQVSGVCGGLADYCNTDRDVFRAIVVVVALFSGVVPVLLIYMILAFILPTDGPIATD